jgi:hypothetical protein
VVNDYFRSIYVWIPFQLLAQFGHVFLWLPTSFHLPGSFPFPGGWLIGGLLLVNLLAAHVIRFKISWKRSGILLIHSGLVILMVSELITGLAAVEARMSIAEGESVNFVDVSHAVELALTTASDAKTDDVVVVPASILRKGGLIQHEALPVDIEVNEYMDNSDLLRVRGDAVNEPDTRQTDDGIVYKLARKSEESGVDVNQREDAPAARVTFFRKGTKESLGTYLLSLWYYPNFTTRALQFPPQQVKVGDQTYTAELRLKREYKPYSIFVKEFRHDRFMGTDTPKNYSSLVRLVDSSRGEDREAKIYMNNPLRYHGETLYQSGFFRHDDGTVLQVVRNPAWLLPYLSCTFVSLGMIVHFGLHLMGFLRRRSVA